MKSSIAPFQLEVRSKAKTFTMAFRGTSKGRGAPAVQGVALEFPRWWAGEIARKLAKLR